MEYISKKVAAYGQFVLVILITHENWTRLFGNTVLRRNIVSKDTFFY